MPSAAFFHSRHLLMHGLAGLWIEGAALEEIWAGHRNVSAPAPYNFSSNLTPPLNNVNLKTTQEILAFSDLDKKPWLRIGRHIGDNRN